MDVGNMQVLEHFGLKKTLDQLFQLIYLSTNLLVSFECQNELGFLKVDHEGLYSNEEEKHLLTYFLDLIEFFTHEKVHLIQDPEDSSRYILNGGS